MSALTLIAVCVGMAIGHYWGYDAALTEGQEFERTAKQAAYEEGFIEGSKSVEHDFPMTADGKYFSTDAAIKYMTDKEDEE